MDQVTVLIPVWKPGKQFDTLLKRLSLQTVRPKRVLILNTVDQGSEDQVSHVVDAWKDAFEILSVFHVEKKEFDHGGTRNLGFTFSDTELVLCMTQDAVPAGRNLIRNLARCFADPKVAAAYGRQLPEKGCSARERFTRNFWAGWASRRFSARMYARCGAGRYTLRSEGLSILRFSMRI